MIKEHILAAEIMELNDLIRKRQAEIRKNKEIIHKYEAKKRELLENVK